MTCYLTNNSNKHVAIIENLIYILCGIDTSSLSIGLHNKKYALILEGNYPIEYLYPFEEICINVRIVHKFIYKNIKVSGSIKNLISEFLLICMKNYLLKISTLRNIHDLETLYVSIQDEMRLYKNFKTIIDVCRNSDESEIYLKIKDIIDLQFFKDLKDVLQKKTNDDIINWILKGKINPSFYIGENKTNFDNIEEGYWKSTYFIKNIESIITKENIDILQCGKLTNLLKILDKDLLICLESNFIVTRGIYGSLSFLKEITYNFIQKDLKYEILLLEKYILMNDMSFYNDLFIDLYNDKSFNISNDFSVHSEENKKFLKKVNFFKKVDMINFKIADLDLNNTIYKILNTKLTFKNNQSILEFLTIGFNPKILSLILTKKDFLELELIFRFLFTFSVIQFFLQKNFEFRFSKLVLCFIQNFKFSIYSNLKNIIFEDIDTLVKDIEILILQILNNLFLVSGEIFLILSELIDISFNFISLDKKEECINIEDFESKFVAIISKLFSKVKNTNCDWWFLHTLECLLDDKYFLR